MTQLRNLRPALKTLQHFELLYTIDAPRKRRLESLRRKATPKKKKSKDLLKGLSRQELEALLKGIQDA